MSAKEHNAPMESLFFYMLKQRIIMENYLAPTQLKWQSIFITDWQLLCCPNLGTTSSCFQISKNKRKAKLIWYLQWKIKIMSEYWKSPKFLAPLLNIYLKEVKMRYWWVKTACALKPGECRDKWQMNLNGMHKQLKNVPYLSPFNLRYKITMALDMQFQQTNFRGTFGKQLPLQLFFETFIQQEAVSIQPKQFNSRLLNNSF